MANDVREMHVPDNARWGLGPSVTYVLHTGTLYAVFSLDENISILGDRRWTARKRFSFGFMKRHLGRLNAIKTVRWPMSWTARWTKQKFLEGATIGSVQAGVDDRIQARVEVFQPLDCFVGLSLHVIIRFKSKQNNYNKKRHPAYNKRSNNNCYGLGCFDVFGVVSTDAERLISCYKVDFHVHNKHK